MGFKGRGVDDPLAGSNSFLKTSVKMESTIEMFLCLPCFFCRTLVHNNFSINCIAYVYNRLQFYNSSANGMIG